MIQTRYKVKRCREYVQDHGYTDERVIEHQKLLKLTVIAGVIVRTRVIDTEVIPDHVVIEIGCFGGTSWKSKWATTHPEAYARR